MAHGFSSYPVFKDCPDLLESGIRILYYWYFFLQTWLFTKTLIIVVTPVNSKHVLTWLKGHIEDTKPTNYQLTVCFGDVLTNPIDSVITNTIRTCCISDISREKLTSLSCFLFTNYSRSSVFNDILNIYGYLCWTVHVVLTVVHNINIVT